MSAESFPAVAADFLAVAVRLKILTVEQADRLRAESAHRSISPEAIALQRGELDAIQIDIVSSLLHPRDSIPGYELLEVLGYGGMGVVYRARQLALNRIVALKTILINRVGDPSAAERFEQEAQTVGQLRHPNVVTAYDFGRAAGRVFLAMELVDGSDAEKLVAQMGPLAETMAWGLTRQAAAGLSHAHNHGVVHRDIKPANLLLVEPHEGSSLAVGFPMVKIADFGLARITEADSRTRLTMENTAVGSPHYMAPEQLEGHDVDHRADVYALGATIYHLLLGQAPFEGLALTQIVAQKLSTGPRPIEAFRADLDPRSVALIRRMMSRDPAERPGRYSELVREIDHLLGTLPSMAGSVAAATSSLRFSEPVFETKTLTSPQTATSIAKTQTTARPPIRGAKRWWPWIVSALAMMALAAGFLIPSRLTRREEPPTENGVMEPVGATRYLFKGTSLAGWTPRSGQWTPTPDHEISGSGDGVLGRVILKDAATGSRPEPLPFYRLTLLARLGNAQAAELHFGFAPAASRNGERRVVRLTREALQLGYRPSDTGDFVEEKRRMLAAGDPQAEHTLTIECQSRDWVVLHEEEFVFSTPRRSEGELPDFRLAVSGGTAYFSDIEVTELQPSRSKAGERSEATPSP